MIKKFKKIKENRKTKKEFIQNIPSAYDKAKISWVAPEYMRYERGIVWKVGAVLSLIVAVGLGIFLDAWTFSVAITAFAVAYYVIHLTEEPKDQEVVLSKIGVKVGNRKYPFSQIKAFWIIYEPPFTKMLFIRLNEGLLRDIEIQMSGIEPSEIREFLIEKIPELEGQKEPLGDILLKIFKI